jgi:hypothetical protein
MPDLGRCFAKIFFKLYPTKQRSPKECPNREGHKLRSLFALLTFGHGFFFLLSLAFIGFWPMMEDLIYSCFVYSIYLTLSRVSIIIYMILLLLGIVSGLWDIMNLVETW